MFEDVGGKVKKLAVICFVLIVISAFVGGIAAWSNARSGGFLYFLLIFVGGTFVSYVGSLVIYAIGEAAENSSDNAARLRIMATRIMERCSAPEVGTGNTVKCPKCGKEQTAEGGKCALCGAALDG